MKKKEQKEIDRALQCLQRAANFLREDKTIGIARRTDHPNGGSYVINNTEVADEQRWPYAVNLTNKYIGSDIAGVYSALAILQELLKQAEAK